MQTSLDIQIGKTKAGKEADAILRKCVHCGFCNATCPTYQLLGDELDGPRGRIYLIKQALEGNEVTEKTQKHLDRCLGCLACETTCPSGVEYNKLLDIGRKFVEQRVQRSGLDALKRKLIGKILPYRQRFGFLLKTGQYLRKLMPEKMARTIPVSTNSLVWPDTSHTRKMLVLDGCVQPSLAPDINAAAARVLDRLGITLFKAEGVGCCGAMSWHLSSTNDAREFMKQNIDAWWPHIEEGVEAIVMTASGCGSFVKEYAAHLIDDISYAEKAKRISELTVDISEILVNEDLSGFKNDGTVKRLAYHAPCSLQHGQQITGSVEKVLKDAGYELTKVDDPHLCCGSAGTYSILQQEISEKLIANKVLCLESDNPELIVTMNIGCQTHIARHANKKVLHVVELLEQCITTH